MDKRAPCSAKEAEQAVEELKEQRQGCAAAASDRPRRPRKHGTPEPRAAPCRPTRDRRKLSAISSVPATSMDSRGPAELARDVGARALPIAADPAMFPPRRRYLAGKSSDFDNESATRSLIQSGRLRMWLSGTNGRSSQRRHRRHKDPARECSSSEQVLINVDEGGWSMPAEPAKMRANRERMPVL